MEILELESVTKLGELRTAYFQNFQIKNPWKKSVSFLTRTYDRSYI